MTDEDWVKKLLKLCEQKYGRDAPAMRQLRRQLDAIRQSEPKQYSNSYPDPKWQAYAEAATNEN